MGQGIALDGPAPDLLDARAVTYLAIGRSDLAIEDLKDAIAVVPSPVKYLHLAQAYLKARRRNEAKEALRNAEAAGLSAARLTPLERTNCESLLNELALK